MIERCCCCVGRWHYPPPHPPSPPPGPVGPYNGDGSCGEEGALRTGIILARWGSLVAGFKLAVR